MAPGQAAPLRRGLRARRRGERHLSRIALLEAIGLLGQELRDQLEAQLDLATEIRILSQRSESVGTLTEIAGAAAMVQQLVPEELTGFDLVIACQPRAGELAALAGLPPGVSTIVVAPTVPVPGGRPLIADHTLESIARGELVVSPHPAVVGLAHLLRPLVELGLTAATATVLLPASIYEQEALEEVFEQTRALLAFKKPAAGARFPSQLAFNLLPGPPDEAALLEQLAALLPAAVRLAAHTVQAGVFHGVSLSVLAQLAPDTELDDVVAALSGLERIELAEDADTVGPVEAATRDTVLVGEVRAAPGLPGAYWLWAALDNLTRGGASNAIELARRLLGR